MGQSETEISPPWFIGIGASGKAGIHDVQALLSALMPGMNAVILVVIHQAFDHRSYMRDLLTCSTSMPVIVAEEGEHFERGCCYIGEPAAHLTLAALSFGKLVDDPTAYHRNRTVDLLFRSVAAYGGKRVIGVVLSGALDDGSRGLAAIHEAGGKTMVVTPTGPGRPGMPENAIDYHGPIDCRGSPQQIADAIHRLVCS
jgi:chemotaxis response regulator CheB